MKLENYTFDEKAKKILEKSGFILSKSDKSILARYLPGIALR